MKPVKTGFVTGFVFAPQSAAGWMQHAAAGQMVSTPDSNPPWIVVDHSLASICLTDWPGKLWAVEVVEAAPQQPLRNAGYTRATAVWVRQEMPSWLPLGPHGQDVARVIEKASQMTLDEVEVLASMPTAQADKIYSEAWNAWLLKTQADSIHRGDFHGHTLAIGTKNKKSPVGDGLMLVQNVLTQRARALTGDAAFSVDEEGSAVLAPKWQAASTALLHAAMALGAPAWMGPEERQILLAPWTNGLGQPPKWARRRC